MQARKSLRSGRAVAVAMLSGLYACSPAAPQVVVKPKVVPVAKPLVPTVISPSRWVLHPTGSQQLEGRLDLGAVGVLYVGHGGERWLDKPDTTLGPTPAQMLIADDVRAVVRGSDGKFLFVGATGDIHVSDEPLGPIKAKRAAPTPLRSIAAGKQSVLGVSNAGLMRTPDGGVTWNKVTLPSGQGVLLQVAMLPSGEGLALLMPQRVLATDDDGNTWKTIATPGVGARNVLADVNGELLLEGLTASAVLRSAPLRLEKVTRVASTRYELPMPSSESALGFADAVREGRGVLVGDRYVEVSADPEQTARWRLTTIELGKPPVVRKVLELDGCEKAYVGGGFGQLVIGCDAPAGEKKGTKGPSKPWMAPPEPVQRFQLKIFRSADFGATLKDDPPLLHGADRDKRMWLTPDGSLIVDGACKKSKSEYACDDSPPVIRLVGQKSGVAKVVNTTGSRFTSVEFSPSGAKGFAIGTDNNGRLALFISTNGGKDFSRRFFPSVMQPSGGSLEPIGEHAALGVEDGTVTVIAPTGTQWARWVTHDDGASFKSEVLTLDADVYDLAGRRGFAYSMSGKGWESDDAGATWHMVGAPESNTNGGVEKMLVCGEYGCLLGDRAVRVGWEFAGGAAPKTGDAPLPSKKVVGRTPLRCVAEGEWKSLGNVSIPSAGNADLGGGTRWVAPRRDDKGRVTAMVATTGKGGSLDVKEVQLFPPSTSNDVAIYSTMQIEGVAAIRYSFKRDKAPPSTAKPPPMPPVVPKMPPPKPPFKGKIPMPMPTPAPIAKPGVMPITSKQLVDVEVAWYLAATGKVHRGTIKAVGPLEPIKDVIDPRDGLSTARSSLLSIAHGGIHVRPLASSGQDAPLFFVQESGKVEKLTWPEIPTKDLRGHNLSLRIDAARVGKRSVVFGNPPGSSVQTFMAWASENGSTWETRTWGLWPDPRDMHGGDSYLRFVDSGATPVLGVVWSGSAQLAPGGWAVPLQGPDADPGAPISLPGQAVFGDPEKPCATPMAPNALRILAPYSTGTRHPVVITGEGAELVFATVTAVVRTSATGGNADACVSAWDAWAQTKQSDQNLYSSIIAADDLGHASLFRAPLKAPNELSVRSMSCSFVKGPVPAVLADAPGFTETAP